MKLTRRHLLGISTLTACAASVCAGGIVTHWWLQPSGKGYLFFSENEAAFLRAFAGALYPPTNAIAFDGSALQLDHYLDQMLELLPETQQRLMRLLVHVLDSWTIPTHLSSFSSLTREERFSVLDGWMFHDRVEIRQATQALLSLIGMGYTSHPDISPFFAKWHACGFGR